ncbi:phage tail protein [Cohnella faecalis]|uniref:Phage tail protein n=1 Tax=Cohnella faecalis TaxID=2315694 RepID=A0A398CHR5_9BACL|nr:tail fiber protein [Cohnella faecalis]RIE00669.1 phage tail protein [Cohnella faecalis]
MAEPFLGEVRLLAFNYPPQGWVQCNGQLLSISQNQALFTLLGNSYGGDGKTTFAVPNLQGSVPVQTNNASVVGAAGGEAAHTLTINEMPAHTHEATGGADATSATPLGNAWGTQSAAPAVTSYEPTANTTMNSNALQSMGASQPHSNMQPYLVINYCIAVEGYYPPKPN